MESQIPKPWALKAAFLIVDGTCLLAALYGVCCAIRGSSFEMLAGLICPSGCLFCLSLIMRRGGALARLFSILFGFLAASLWSSVADWMTSLAILPFVALPVLLCLPPSGRWFAAARQEQGKRPMSWLRELCLGCFASLVLVLGLFCRFRRVTLNTRSNVRATSTRGRMS